MKVETTPVDQHQVTLTIEVPAEEVAKGIKDAVARLAQQVNIPGFRKGKAPRKILEAHFGKDVVLGEASELLVNRFYDRALREQDLIPVTQADIDMVTFEEGKDMTFKATFVKKPEVKLGDYKGLTVDHTHTEVTDDMVEEQLQAMAKQHAKLVAVEDAALENGDVAMIDFAGKVDGEAFDGGEGKSYPLEIGSGSFIPGFEEQLVGHKAGEEVIVKVNFPDDYFVDTLAGKEAEFTVNIIDVKRRELPALDDDFAKAASSFATMDELRKVAKQSLQNQVANREMEQYHNALIQKAVANADVDIPEAMVENRIDQMIEELKLNLESRNMKFEDYLAHAENSMEKLRETYRESALKSVRTDTVLEAICKEEGIEVTSNDMNMEIYQMAQNFDADPREVLKIIQKEGRLPMLAQTVARRKAAALIIQAAAHTHDNEEAKADDAAEEKPAKKPAKKAAKKAVKKDAEGAAATDSQSEE